MKDNGVEEHIKLEIVERNGCEQVYEPPTEKADEKLPQSNLRADMWNFFLLTVLFFLQGIPIQMAVAMPVILQSRGVSSIDQGKFSLATYPWNMKILWAPLVDLVYWRKLGRRKSWIIPTQYLLGIITFYISLNIDDWIGGGSGAKPPNIQMLTITFFLSNLLSAIQDVAVDGWSVTMLKRENVGHAATCNSIAYCISMILGFFFFIVLDSKDFCNKWLRSTPKETGLLPFSSCIMIWSIMYFATTTLILIFKKDHDFDIVEKKFKIKAKLVESYSMLWAVLKIKPVQLLILFYITHRVGMASVSVLGPLRLIDAGYTTVTFALLMAAIVPFKLIFILIFNRLIVGEKCLLNVLHLVLQNIILGVCLAVSIYCIPIFKIDGEIQWWYSILIFIAFCSFQIWQFLLLVSLQAYSIRISDSRFGGTYITIFASVRNVGQMGLASLSLFLLNFSTIGKCKTTTGIARTEKCPATFDGFYVQVIVSTIIGLLWILWARKIVSKLYSYSPASWLVEHRAGNNILQKS